MYILLLAPRPAGKAPATSILGAVCKERATPPAGLRAAARRGAAAGGHLLCCRSSTMHTGIACVAAPRICPPGARAKMHTLFPDGPLEVNSRPYRTDAAREKKNCSAGVLAWINLFAPAGAFAGWKPALHFFGLAIADCGFEIYGKVRS